MPTIARILELAPVSCMLANNYKNTASPFRGGVPRSATNQATLIYIYWKILNKIYTLDPTHEGLQAPANYLWELEQKFAFKAANIVDGGGGGQITPIGPPSSINFPFYIYSSDFESDGKTYLNSKLTGINLAIFIDEGSQQFFPSTNFTYVAGGGITITADWFDATQFDYTVRVERYFAPPS